MRSTAIKALAGAATLVLATATPALAHECVNLNKQPGAGAQVVFDLNGTMVSADTGVLKRAEKGVLDLETGEGFHGLVGYDLDGDGASDVDTWLVGPEGEIPGQAQHRGSECNGVISLDAAMACGLEIPEP
jgi:hypothetical protein